MALCYSVTTKDPNHQKLCKYIPGHLHVTKKTEMQTHSETLRFILYLKFHI